MMKNTEYLAFDKTWFIRHQRKLLWALNNCFYKKFFRSALNFSCSSVGDRNIIGILPNAIFWKGERKDQFVVEFRTHQKYSKRIYYSFALFWWLLHFWDWSVADRWIPRLSFGFDTLTKYPNAQGDSGQNTVDGSVQTNYGFDSGKTWDQIRNGPGTQAFSNRTTGSACSLASDLTSNTWQWIIRSIFLFDTSSLGADANITNAVLSLYGYDKTDDLSISPTTDIYTSNPASNTSLIPADYTTLGTISQTGSPIAYSNWSVAYNPFTFNSTGISNINKTGISKFGSRNANYDTADSPPTWLQAAESGVGTYYADETGATKDPKLVVTYNVGFVRSFGAIIG